MPVGSPLASRSMAPPCGGLVLPVMPAAARAAELAMEMWPSMRSRNAGWPPVTLSRSWRVGSVLLAQSVWSQLPPVSQWPAGASLAKACDLRQHFRQRFDAGQVDVQLGLAGASQVDVRVVEAGKDEVLVVVRAQVVQAGFRSGEARDLLGGADGQNFAAADGHGLHGLRLVFVRSRRRCR
jgi:hypothetical protein